MLKFNKLSRAEMKNVLGGNMPVDRGSCSAFLPNGHGASGSSYSNADCTVGTKGTNGGTNQTIIGISQSEVLAITNGVAGAHYCCTDCASATWMQSCS